MRAYTLLLSYSLLAFITLNISSCDKMDDIQKKYADEEEEVYLGKVDSVKIIPGFGKVMLKWEVSADPRINLVRVYWNNRNDSISKEFNRLTSGNLTDSLIIENIPEGNYTFELRTENDRGDLSLSTFVSGSVWGPDKGDDLGDRSIIKYDFNHSESDYNLQLSPVQKVSLEDSMVFSEISYINTEGDEKTIRVPSNSMNISLDNFAEGSEFSLRDAFVSINVLDTIYNNYRSFMGPKIIRKMGDKLEIKGHNSSDYFALNDSVFCEWEQNGDIISYIFVPNNIQQNNTIQYGNFNRDSFNNVFYYGNNKFIAVSHKGEVSMHELVNDTVSRVLTPDGNEVMGTGFVDFKNYLPGNGFFFTTTVNTGDLRTWFAFDNATWGSPNGSTVGTGFDQYKLLAYFNSALLTVDHDGFLWAISLRTDGAPEVYRKIGSGWEQFDNLIAIGENLLAIDDSGQVYLFENIDSSEEYRIIN